MKIKTIHLREVHIPLKFQFSQANNSGTQSSLTAILEIQTEDGIIGYGESCPRTYVTGETIKSIQQDLKTIEPFLFSENINSIDQLTQQLSEWKKKGIGNCTLCAFELAWLDAWSKKENLPLTKLLDISLPSTLDYSLVIPLLPSNKLEKLLERVKFFKPSSIKLKVNNQLDQTLENLILLRRYFGENTSIRFDINGGWTLEEAKFLIPKFLEQKIHSFEQPLDAENLEGSKILTQQFDNEASVMLDESILSLDRANYLLENKICNHFNLKISKTGGLFRTFEIFKSAKENGIPCQLGAHFGETSLLASAGVLLSGLCGNLTAHEGALSEFLLEKDWVTPQIQQEFSGKLKTENLFLEAGFTSSADLDVLKKYTV